METIGTWWMWAGFVAFVLVMIAVDLYLLGGKESHRVSFREAAVWSALWVGVSLSFAALLWFYLDATAGAEFANLKTTEFLTGYLIEKALAVDNVFVWLMIFTYFSIPAEMQRRVLIYGILGAIALRTVLIFAGAILIARFHWILYLFGAFLLITGIKMLMFADAAGSLDDNPLLRWIRRHVPLTSSLHGERFAILEGGKRWFTPLFVVLVMVAISDVIFAVDSIPAIFAITTDPFIVLTSNIFAILGLRAMYFMLAGFAERFALLKYALALVLVFIGTKMLIVDWVKIPISISLGVVAAIITTGMLASLWHSRKRI
ncbi:MAG: TerC family protein [Candidatus Dactylopiibacterium sp.]|nr:TerC family protein [Candidatus Dactylopiibacterium sp.]